MDRERGTFLLTFSTTRKRTAAATRGWHDRPRPVADDRDAAVLTQPMRTTVTAAILGISDHHPWTVHALDVGATRVQVVIESDYPPERTITELKAWATVALTTAGLVPRGQKVWAPHGTIQALHAPGEIEEAIRLLIEASPQPE